MMAGSSHPPRALDLPELRAAILDWSGVEQLFTDLAFETQILAVLLKGGEFDRRAAAAPSLGAAREALRSGTATGVQLRYVHAGVEWWDTLMQTEAGIRVVRIRKEAPPDD